MQVIELKDLIHFIDDFTKLETNIKSANITSELDSYNTFFRKYDKLEVNLEKILKEQSPYYNVFSILNIRHYEARVHTPFLCNLFDPNESHGQGLLFFNKFLKKILNNCNTNDVIENVEVYEELSMKYGRLDILIDYQINKKKKTLVIENKIYHHDGEQQLYRYYNYLKDERGLRNDDFQIIYLTVHKCIPSAHSISRSLYNELEHDNNIICLGYKEDIVNWLSDCIPEVSSERVIGLLNQYIETIQTL